MQFSGGTEDSDIISIDQYSFQLLSHLVYGSLKYARWYTGSKGQNVELENSHGLVNVVNGFDRGDNGICKYTFSRLIFEKHSLPGIHFIKWSGFILVVVVDDWASCGSHPKYDISVHHFSLPPISEWPRLTNRREEQCPLAPSYLLPSIHLPVGHKATNVALETPDHQYREVYCHTNFVIASLCDHSLDFRLV